jgi:hypothetical protein
MSGQMSDLAATHPPCKCARLSPKCCAEKLSAGRDYSPAARTWPLTQPGPGQARAGRQIFIIHEQVRLERTLSRVGAFVGPRRRRVETADLLIKRATAAASHPAGRPVSQPGGQPSVTCAI